MNWLERRLLWNGKSIYRKELFYPSFLGLFINPFYFARKGLMKHIKKLSPYVTGRTLDVGCGTKPYRDLFRCSEYVGLEIDRPMARKFEDVDYYYDGTVFPFDNASFDTVVLFQVLEHVFRPSAVMSEIARVVKPGGVVLMTVPFIWDEHEQPFDFARYTSFGIEHIVKEHGFDILEHSKSVCDVRVIFQLIALYIFKKIKVSSTYLRVLLTVIFISPWNILGELIGLLLPANQDLYLDNVYLLRRIDT